MSDSSLLFEWRWALASERGPHPTMRHVLLTLSLHMNADGGSCYPSVRTLAQETGLNKDTVTARLKDAVGARWLTRRRRTGHGRGWRLTEYFPHFPEGVRRERTPSEDVSEEVGHPEARRVRNEPVKVSEEVGQSTTRNSTKKKMSEFDEDAREVLELCNRLRLERRLRRGLSGRPLKATPKRLSKIKARRRDGFSLAELLDVPRAFYADPWEGRDRYDDPIYAFKDDATVQAWLDKPRNGPVGGTLVDLQLVAGGGP